MKNHPLIALHTPSYKQQGSNLCLWPLGGIKSVSSLYDRIPRYGVNILHQGFALNALPYLDMMKRVARAVSDSDRWDQFQLVLYCARPLTRVCDSK